MVVVLPESIEQVARVLRYCHEHGIRVVPRGAGTSLSGGALPLADGVLLGMGKFNRIREIDFENRVAVAEPGVTNLAISQAVAHEGFYYAPDPSSQIACSIGGNIAENSGGVHCLKYGMIVLSSPLIPGNVQTLSELALRYRVAAVTLFPDFARVGGLLAYGPNLLDLIRQVGVMRHLNS